MQGQTPFQVGAGWLLSRKVCFPKGIFPSLLPPSRCSETLSPAREGTRGSRELTLCLGETGLLLIPGKYQSEDTI